MLRTRVWQIIRPPYPIFFVPGKLHTMTIWTVRHRLQQDWFQQDWLQQDWFQQDWLQQDWLQQDWLQQFGRLVPFLLLLSLASITALAQEEPSLQPPQEQAGAPQEQAGAPQEQAGAPQEQAGPPQEQAAGEEAAYHLRKGSLARNRIVVIGRDLLVDGEAWSHAVAISGSVRISGRVKGDVIVLGGDVALAETAEVSGDVYVLDGRIEATAGAVVGGRSVAYPEAADLWVALVQGPIVGLPAGSPVVMGARLALLAFWAVVILLAMSLGRRELLSTSESVRREPFRNFMLGMTAVFALLLTGLFFSLLSGVFLGVPLVILVMVVALMLRFWGMVAVFHALGEWLGRRLQKRPPLPLMAASYGLVALGILKFLPQIGIVSWSIATFIGVGATLSTRFGRDDAWFEGLP